MTYSVAVIGTGANPEDPDETGFAMAYQHADGYQQHDSAELVACADLVRENADAFADNYDIADQAVYEEYSEMMEATEPDVVSVCVPPAVHAAIVLDIVSAPGLQAIHCEKPMALTWGDSRLMAQEASRRDVNLTFNHQRRFGKPFRQAKELLDAGEIGELERLEVSGENLFDYCTHFIDLANYFNDERLPEWVIGQIDYREEVIWFGAHNENQAIALWEYENGVTGFAATGTPGDGPINGHNTLIGSEGEIRIGTEETPLKIRRAGQASWEHVDCGNDDIHRPNFVTRAIDDVIEALESGEESELCARNALSATEIIFAAWESSRRRGRVDLPLEIEDNPLESMVETGQVNPEPAEK